MLHFAHKVIHRFGVHAHELARVTGIEFTRLPLALTLIGVGIFFLVIGIQVALVLEEG